MTDHPSDLPILTPEEREALDRAHEADPWGEGRRGLDVDAEMLRADEARRFPGRTERFLTPNDIRCGSGCRRDPIWLHWYGQVHLWHLWFEHEARKAR